jgi:hypothetical protein
LAHEAAKLLHPLQRRCGLPMQVERGRAAELLQRGRRLPVNFELGRLRELQHVDEGKQEQAAEDARP